MSEPQRQDEMAGTPGAAAAEEEDLAARAFRRIRNMLKAVAEVAETSSLTGALSDGAPVAVGQYNRALERLGALDADTAALFEPLPEDADFDSVGVASKLLSRYLEDEEEEARDGGRRRRERRREHGPRYGHEAEEFERLEGMEGIEDLKDLGRMIRENLPDYLHGHGAPAPPPPPAPPYPYEPEPR